MWDVLEQCESGGRNIPNSTGSSASGYWQITDGTWRAHGGAEFASRAMFASRTEQLTVAERIYKRRGSLADWNASRGCWEPKLGRHSSERDAPQHALRTDEIPRHNLGLRAASGTYAVMVGDTLFTIASVHNVPGGWQALYERNRDVVEDPDRIYPGERLRIAE
jgi:hypothetical protein